MMQSFDGTVQLFEPAYCVQQPLNGPFRCRQMEIDSLVIDDHNFSGDDVKPSGRMDGDHAEFEYDLTGGQ